MAVQVPATGPQVPLASGTEEGVNPSWCCKENGRAKRIDVQKEQTCKENGHANRTDTILEGRALYGSCAFIHIQREN
jgi:hypothetical protein